MEFIKNNPKVNKITIEKSYSNWIEYLFYVDNKIVWNSNEKIKTFIPKLFISTMNEINKNLKFELV